MSQRKAHLLDFIDVDEEDDSDIYKIYYWNCGHRSTTYKRDQRRSNCMLCPICKLGISMATRVFCQDCGVEIGFFPSSVNFQRVCEDCLLVRRKKSVCRRDVEMDMERETKAVRMGKVPLESTRKPDCRHYLAECLPKAAMQNNGLSCRRCDRYDPMTEADMADASLDLMMVNGGDSFSTVSVRYRVRAK